MVRTAAVAVAVALAALAVAPGTARAQARDVVARPLVLAAGAVEARLSLEANLAARRFARPLSVAPDLHLGATDRWTLGVVHSSGSLGLLRSGATLCLRGDDSTCAHRYRGSGLDARWLWRDRGGLAIAPRARLLVRDVDPWKPAVTVGALVRYTRGRFAVIADPYLRAGLANTDRGNRTALVIPVWLAVQPTCRWQLALHTGWDGDLAVARDGWHVPVALAATARVTAQLDVGVEAGFPTLLGPQNDQKQRIAVATVRWLTTPRR